MSAVRFRFVLDGQVVEGPVQGAGGTVGETSRMESLVRRAAKGRPLSVYEPAPGCVVVYPDYSHLGDGAGVVIPLAAFVGEVTS